MALSMALTRNAPIVAIAALSLAACAGDAGTDPSLARRPAERVTGIAPVATPTPEAPAPASAAILGKLDSLVSQAHAAHRRFTGKQGRVQALVGAAAGAAAASEAWSLATVALSDLESTRSDAMVAMAELDTLYAGAVVGNQSATEIAAARKTVQDLISDEDHVIEGLRARLP